MNSSVRIAEPLAAPLVSASDRVTVIERERAIEVAELIRNGANPLFALARVYLNSATGA